MLVLALASIIQSLEKAVVELEMLSELDQQKLSQWNRAVPVPLESCLHDIISHHCHSQPDAPAVVSWDGLLTYRELDGLLSTLAGQLHAAGVGPEVFVPVCFARCKWMLVAMLGIIKAGSAFCTLDPSYPHSRLTEICRALKLTVILTTVNNCPQADRLRVPLSTVCPSNALYTVFTSGSTGTSKGIILHFVSYAFDLSIFEILTALTAGVSLAILSEEARITELPRAIRELQATWAFLISIIAHLYRVEDFPSLRTLSLGGEAISSLDVAM
ncbi:hypothetical protein BDV28DRAFT_152504 [Aspergillus coremiiformis]|uniref:AMP-dependent synthetase/ligase domain-containing protein n=1 Tax=Aspergillus coremiiformis TaxID=138285 RepID=A0A5N6YV55_9EURO|nr:hypothetical protein BDV28DRAFT_152504 [Aspergillus coremiiformis]